MSKPQDVDKESETARVAFRYTNGVDQDKTGLGLGILFALLGSAVSYFVDSLFSL